MTPRGIGSRIYAMARPRRPAIECQLVRAAAPTSGSVAQRATAVARAVAAEALVAIDETEPVVSILRALATDPVSTLARDPSIDTGATIRIERARRADARGGRRLPEAEWQGEDREILKMLRDTLARRYRAHLSK